MKCNCKTFNYLSNSAIPFLLLDWPKRYYHSSETYFRIAVIYRNKINYETIEYHTLDSLDALDRSEM